MNRTGHSYHHGQRRVHRDTHNREESRTPYLYDWGNPVQDPTTITRPNDDPPRTPPPPNGHRRASTQPQRRLNNAPASKPKQAPINGWASSMALFSASSSSPSNSPQPENVTESYHSNRFATTAAKPNRLHDATVRETSTAHTAPPMYQFRPTSLSSADDNSADSADQENSENNDNVTSIKNNHNNNNIPNPWMTRVESLTTPSSLASSTTAASSVFVFGRRPALRTEISMRDSVSVVEPSPVNSIVSNALAGESILGRHGLQEDDEEENDDQFNSNPHEWQGVRRTRNEDDVDDIAIEVTLPGQSPVELYDEEQGQSSHMRYQYEHDQYHAERHHAQPPQSRILRNTLEEWTRLAGHELVRVGEIAGHELVRVSELAGTELRHLSRYAAGTTNRILNRAPPLHPLSPIMDPWHDLEELQKTHQDKMDRLKTFHVHDHYDFALVLTPQTAYSFWAERLDFRAEQLGELLTSVPSADHTVESQDDQEDENIPETPIDERPFSTPQTGIRRRRNTTSPPDSEATKASVRINTNIASDHKMAWSAGITDSETRLVKPRLSLFEKAVGVFTPNTSRMSMGGSRQKLGGHDTPTSLGGAQETGITSTNRRRWGNRPDITPGMSTFTSKKRFSNSRLSPFSDEGTTSNKRRKLSQDELYPSQVVPRGIAARSNGMVQFLSALKRGIVVRRHRPGMEATFVKIFSTDGGDTIRFEPIHNEEAMLAFREQRVRYNRRLAKRKGIQIQSQRWAHVEEEEDEQVQNFELPDFIAAEQYRKKQLEKNRGLKTAVLSAATKLKSCGNIKIQDVIAVHPGRHEDPRAKGELGTSQLRRSKSEFDPNFSFSIVQKANRVAAGSKKRATLASERWLSGEGNDAQFKTMDFEAATEGEYWLVFRGFLLLHRDAVAGRFASNRMAGFGSNYREELASDDDQNRLQSDAFHEPRTIGWLERRIADWRKIDLTLDLIGSAEPGAIPPPSDYFLGFKSPGTQIWSRLRQAGLETTRIYAIDPTRVMIKVRCPADRLTDVAEVLRIKLKTRDGNFVPFREDCVGIFAPLNDELDAPDADSLFRSFQRQKVIDFIIRSRIRDSGAELGQNTDLGKMIQARVPLHMPKKLESLYHVWFYFNRRENWTYRDGRSMSVGPTDPLGNDLDEHQPRSPRHERGMPNIFSRFLIGVFYQPLDSIEQYFGEQVTFYFAWLQHCSHHLVFLSGLGFIVSICQLASDKWDHPIRPFFSVAVMIWSFYVLVKWRQRSYFLAYRWGTMDLKEQETTRPQFKGEYRRDEITGEWVVHYTPWKRYIKYAISFPITLAFTAGTLVLILMVHANRDLMLANYFAQKNSPGSEEFHMEFSISAIGRPQPIHSVELNSENMSDPQFWFIMAGLPSLLGLFLPLLNFILMRISVMLNDFENYRTESHYRTALIVKVFSFRFVCYFATLYYYAFLSVGDAESIENGILRVGTGVFVYITVAHYWGLFIQIYVPMLIYQIRRRKQKKRLHEELIQVEREEAELEELSDEEKEGETIKERRIHLINKRLLLDQAQDELWQEVMLPQHDSFPEYINAVVQFAYVTCFSVVLPMTPVICLMNHLISMRLDAYKLCKTRTRPLAQTTGGIGVWEHVLHIVSVIAILTNCWLMGFTNAKFYSIVDDIGENGEVVLFAIVVCWEHVMLLIKYIIQASTPKLPKSVRDKMAKDQYDQERKRNSSMRQKKDRRSFRKPSDRVADFISPSDKSSDSVASKSLATASPASVLNHRTSGSKGPHGLMTIPSEDLSECSASNNKPGITTSSVGTLQSTRIPLQTINKNVFVSQNAKATSNSRTSTDSDSQDIRIPTPFHLGSSLEAEAIQDTSMLRPQRILNSRFSNAASSRSSLGTVDDDSHTTTTTVATIVSKLPRPPVRATATPVAPSAPDDDANALAKARQASARFTTARRFPSTPEGDLHEA